MAVYYHRAYLAFTPRGAMAKIEPAIPFEIETASNQISLPIRIVDAADTDQLDLIVWAPNPTGQGWLGPPAGIWRRAGIAPNQSYGLGFRLSPFDQDSVTLTSDDSSRAEITDCIVRSDYRCWPRQSLGIALVGSEGVLHSLNRIDIISSHSQVLAAHYRRKGHSDSYVAVKDDFSEAYHAARIRQVKRLIPRFAGSGPVLDAGSGYSLLHMAGLHQNQQFSLVCCDWDQGAMSFKAGEHPESIWVTAAADELPFKSEIFSLTFVGEVIEHLPDPYQGLEEWKRVTRRGGYLLITTPNRCHRLNRLQRSETPENLEHLHEFEVNELKSILNKASLEPVQIEGLYYAAVAYRMPGVNWIDPLRSQASFRGKGKLLKLCMELGRWKPRSAYNLCVIARKT